MKLFTSLLTCAAVGLPLSSCVEWRLGKKIRESGECITALQMGTPVEGRLYASRQAPPVAPEKEWEFFPDWKDKNTTFYARVPVVEYRHRSSTIYWHLPHAIGGTFETEDKPTGQSRIVAIRDSKMYLMPEDFELPKGLRCVRADTPRSAASGQEQPMAPRHDAFRLSWHNWHHDLTTSKSVPATIAAAPFDYLIDPALTAASTTVVVTIAGIGVGVWWLGDTLTTPFCQSESASTPQHSEPTVPATP